MAAKNPKSGVVTFKAEAALLERLAAVPNKSAFTRNAVLAALENTCPLCNGAGTVSEDQSEHWRRFMRGHHVQTCDTCHENFLVCDKDPKSRHRH